MHFDPKDGKEKRRSLISKKNQIQGKVTLKVAFLKDGTIGDISVVKRINKELNESAVSAANLIRFESSRKKEQANNDYKDSDI